MKCNAGATLHGNNPITCNAGGKFSDIPTCEPDCTADSWRTLSIEHSVTPANLPVTYLTKVTVKCEDKYSINPVSVVTCTANGLFTYNTGQKPICYKGMHLTKILGILNFLIKSNSVN